MKPQDQKDEFNKIAEHKERVEGLKLSLIPLVENARSKLFEYVIFLQDKEIIAPIRKHNLEEMIKSASDLSMFQLNNIDWFISAFDTKESIIKKFNTNHEHIEAIFEKAEALKTAMNTLGNIQSKILRTEEAIVLLNQHISNTHLFKLRSLKIDKFIPN